MGLPKCLGTAHPHACRRRLRVRRRKNEVYANFAKTEAHKYCKSVSKGLRLTQAMHEKYDCRFFGAIGRGGEYAPQTGFGWTNGVALAFLAKYGGWDEEEEEEETKAPRMGLCERDARAGRRRRRFLRRRYLLVLGRRRTVSLLRLSHRRPIDRSIDLGDEKIIDVHVVDENLDMIRCIHIQQHHISIIISA